MEGFCCGTFCIDHFVFIKHHMDVCDISTCFLRDQATVDQVFGGNKNFAFAEQQLCAVALEQHPVLRRHEQIALLTSDDARPDPDRGKPVQCWHSARLDPADRLQSVVTGHDKLTNL